MVKCAREGVEPARRLPEVEGGRKGEEGVRGLERVFAR